MSDQIGGAKSVVDNRPESSVQRKLIQFGKSNSLLQKKNIQDSLPAQLATPEEELPAQGKFEPGQLKTAQLVGGPEEELPAQGKFEKPIQLAGGPEEELPAQGKFENTTQLKTAQLVGGPEEELPAQGKFEQAQLKAIQLVGGPEEELPAQGKFETPVQKKSVNNTGMPDNLKSGVESLSGASLDHVKVHYGSDKPAQLNALAYAQGSDIHLGPGQEKHLPHEAWHVVQQMQGRVEPTTAVNDVAVNDDVSLETEADVMGDKAMKL